MLHYLRKSIALQEVPNEISLAYEISGCPLRCLNCHSPELQSGRGLILDQSSLLARIVEYDGLISCVLFLGGDWSKEIISLLSLVRDNGLKTALYSGFESVSDEIRHHLDYLKVGPYKEKLGGLNSPTTNQIFTHVPSNTNLNHLFLSS